MTRSLRDCWISEREQMFPADLVILRKHTQGFFRVLMRAIGYNSIVSLN